ncbi:MAG: hypothetical protein HYV95_07655 [Opitutae bacterium]|nr:hypothetical protein [Opitutae bacterium]
MALYLAYLDLGAGSMLLQMLLAGILGLSLTIKTYWRRIARLIRRDKPDDHPADDTASTKNLP